MAQITASRLRELLHYESETGRFYWLSDRGGSARAGTLAGSINGEGYLAIQVDGQLYLAHRLAWLWVHERWPTATLDHKNRVRTDNRLANLREATRAQNRQNTGLRANNTSGFTGAFWFKPTGKWVARIGVDGRKVFLGSYDSAEAAHEAYKAAAAKLHTHRPAA